MPVITVRTRRPLFRAIAMGAVLGVTLGALALWAMPGGLRQAAATAQSPAAPTDTSAYVLSPVDSAPVMATAPLAAPALLPPPPVHVIPRAPTPMAMPYRFIGRVTIDGESGLVFFGRGRTITLRAPGPLDSEFAVDEIHDNQVVLRHVPTGTSKSIEFVARQAATAAPAPPESSPQD